MKLTTHHQAMLVQVQGLPAPLSELRAGGDATSNNQSSSNRGKQQGRHCLLPLGMSVRAHESEGVKGERDRQRAGEVVAAKGEEHSTGGFGKRGHTGPLSAASVILSVSHLGWARTDLTLEHEKHGR